ncbi:MAG: acyltransferase [Candidatus Competibacter sp.]|nr:acyltransferase [Candidatus Competibacter sp.]MDG4584679.1 acyltransferase [Candidatus Competibacter sp.]
MKKFPSIQALRGVALLGVIAFHVLSIEKKYSGGDLLLPEFLSLGQSGVDLFFVISGFIMVTVTKSRFMLPREVIRFLWGRLTRIYPTYWFYFFLTLTVFLIKPDWVNSSQEHQAQLISSFLLLPSHRLPLVMVAWSLIHELWFYLVFSIFLNFRECFLPPSLLIWGTIVVVVNLLVTVTDFSGIALIALHAYSLEFIIGALVALFFYQEHTANPSTRNAILIIVLVPSFGFPIIHAFDILAKEGLVRACVVGTLYGFLVYSVAALEKSNGFSLPKPLQFLGDISYTVYLSHVLVLSAIGRLWLTATPSPNGLLDNALACLAMLTAVVSYGWVGYRLIEYPLLQISHRLRARWFDHGCRDTPKPALHADAARLKPMA